VKLILEASGSSWENLVDVTVFLTDMKKDFSVFNKIYGEYFKSNQPSRTTIEVNALPTPIAIELKCIAVV
jgi:2-aminomuconate deaminase